MSDELIAFAMNHSQRKFDTTNPWHGAVLAIAQASGNAQLLVANANGNQALTGGKLTVAAGVTGYASLNVPHGVAPTTPTNGDLWTTTAGLFARVNGATEELAVLSSNTFTGTQIMPAATTALASLRIPHGTAPTTPTNGDVWSTTGGVLVRVNGVSQQLAHLSANTFTGLQTLGAGLTVSAGTITLPAASVADIALTSNVVLKNSAAVFTAKVSTLASATGGAGFNVPHGVAPTSPVDGDVWTTTAGVFVRLNGATSQLSVGGSGVTTFNTRSGAVTLTSSDVTTALGYTPASSGAGTTTFTGDVVMSANLTVNGALTTINTTNLDVFDKLIHLNKVAGTNVPVPTGFSGLMIDRGDVASVARTQAGLVWDETNQRFMLGLFTNDTTMSVETNLRLASMTATGGIFIGTTTAGTSPTNYLGFSSTNCLYVEAGGNTIINSIGNAQIIIDADNNSTANTFKVRANTSNTSGGIDLLTVTEAGDTTATGNLFGVQHASIGSAGSAGAAVILDSTGKIPTVALPNPTDKAPVRIASTANLGLTGLAAIDGVTPVAGDRILAKNQTTTTQNGVYVAAAGAWARSTDADVSAEVLSGTLVVVNEGTQANTAWTLTTDGTINLGVTGLTFARFNSDALTLNGAVDAVVATANTLVKRGADSTILAANHASLGSAGAAGTAIVANASGFVPTAALPPTGIPGTLAVVADVTAAKALTGLSVDNLVMVKDLGIFRFAAAQTEADDDETVIDVTSGGQLIMEAAHADAIYAYLDTQNAALQDQVDALVAARPYVAARTLTSDGASVLTWSASRVPVNPYNEFDGTTALFTAKYSGVYQVSASLTVGNSGTEMYYSINGETPVLFVDPTGAPNVFIGTETTAFDLSEGDTILLTSGTISSAKLTFVYLG